MRQEFQKEKDSKFKSGLVRAGYLGLAWLAGTVGLLEGLGTLLLAGSTVALGALGVGLIGGGLYLGAWAGGVAALEAVSFLGGVAAFVGGSMGLVLGGGMGAFLSTLPFIWANDHVSSTVETAKSTRSVAIGAFNAFKSAVSKAPAIATAKDNTGAPEVISTTKPLSFGSLKEAFQRTFDDPSYPRYPRRASYSPHAVGRSATSSP